ncbi:bacteriohemerythrin [Ramlibacter sp.]|uniref:bacteriohemerythrin n=1 Tax=Ramlibacter sp. TaxID=1917967 RepID=UPI002C367D7C|nr:bacteriohemerythrin [Ramlibacter sp.]HWI81989.1 bacteriohemerythrin [Ramlibacter sp.]
MSLFVWDAKYTLNIAEIDAQHQRLFALFNELYDAMQQGRGNDIVGQVLADVVDYTGYHFATEERLLRQYGYPEAASHHVEHASLSEQANGLRKKLDGSQGEVALATLKFLCDWLNRHILGSDKKFAPFLIDRGAR